MHCGYQWSRFVHLWLTRRVPNTEQQEMYDNVEMKEGVKKPTDAEVVYDTVVQQLSSRKNSKSSNTAPAADGTEGSLSIKNSFSSVEGGGYENTTFELDK